MMNYIVAWNTDVGRRTVNQDSLLIRQAVLGRKKILLAVVCDGMGGLEKGELASASLVRAFSVWFEEQFPSMTVQNVSEKRIFLSWDRLIKKLNGQIGMYGRQRGIRLGTTVTAMLFFKDCYYLAQVGDSRAYELAGQTKQLTEDQTLTAREAALGRMTPEEAESDDRRHILLQCVGACGKVEPVYRTGRIRKKAIYLLCSDGFCHRVNSAEIGEAFQAGRCRTEQELEHCCRQLTGCNKERGEQDNISVIAIRTMGG
jgi:serine/threonine protein phosphatase PrpC